MAQMKEMPIVTLLRGIFKTIVYRVNAIEFTEITLLYLVMQILEHAQK